MKLCSGFNQLLANIMEILLIPMQMQLQGYDIYYCLKVNFHVMIKGKDVVGFLILILNITEIPLSIINYL